MKRLKRTVSSLLAVVMLLACQSAYVPRVKAMETETAEETAPVETTEPAVYESVTEATEVSVETEPAEETIEVSVVDSQPAALATTASGACGKSLTWTLDDTGTLTISGSGAMYNYASGGNGEWTNIADQIKTVVIGPEVTSLGNYAFSYLTALEEISIPAQITNLPSNLFYRCTSLKTVQLPDSLTVIGQGAFNHCDALEALTIPQSVTAIGSYAFAWCYSLKELAIPDGITVLSDHIFYSCEALETLILPRTLQEINGYAFCMSGLKKLVIPENVDVVNDYAFNRLDSLEGMYFLGNAPAYCSTKLAPGSFTVYHPADSTGWGETWNDFPMEVWTYTVNSTASCTEGGVESFTSPEHDLVYTRTVKAKGHQGGQWAVAQPATAAQEGSWTRTCSVCGVTETKAIPKLAQTENTPAVTKNNGYQNYIQASGLVNSYLEAENGGYTRIEYTGEHVTIERYDSNFKFLSRKGIELELPKFGGYYSDGNYRFLVFGQNNPQQNNGCEVLRVVRYTMNWDRIDSASLYGANTTGMFDAGSLRMASCGDMLYIRSCHTMYKTGDGLNHQANYTLSIQISTMEITDQYTGIMNVGYGYVSHSFNQFILVDGTRLMAVDHGDGYPRAAVLIKYDKPAGERYFSGTCTNVKTLTYYGSTGNNYTGASIGGFEYSDTAYLVAGNSIVQDGTVNLGNGQRNIYVTATQKDNFPNCSTSITWLTDHADGSKINVSTPQLVKINSGKFMVLWTEGDGLRYAFVDGNGQLIGDIYSGEGALSDCKPIVSGSQVVWYVTSKGTPCFYSIDLNAPKNVSSVHEHYYNYSITTKPTKTATGILLGTCTTCGDSCSIELPMLSEADYDYEVTTEPSCTVYGYGRYTWKVKDYGTVTVTVYLGRTPHTRTYSVETAPTLESEGSLIGVCSVCQSPSSFTLPKLSKGYYQYQRFQAPGCETEGLDRYSYRSSYYGSFDFDVTVEPLSHAYGDPEFSWAKDHSACTASKICKNDSSHVLSYTCRVMENRVNADCENNGSATYTASVEIDGKTYTDEETVVLKSQGHRYNSVVTAPTCTEQGYTTHACSICGDSYVDSYVNATGHSYGKWTVTTKPTCTKMGQERRDCGNCDHSETRQIGASGHSYTAVVTAPTCTEQGCTTHTCSVCSNSYVDGYKDPTGKHTYQDDKDTTCDVCGYIRNVEAEAVVTTPMYRLYNPNSGEHFYTGSIEERDNLVTAGWTYEGVAWNAPVHTGDPVYRVFNPNSGDHHYTMSREEVNNLVALGWKYEGVAWNSASAENIPQYRLYNPNADIGSHHYTSSIEERDYLISLGWRYEGIGWYGMLK